MVEGVDAAVDGVAHPLVERIIARAGAVEAAVVAAGVVDIVEEVRVDNPPWHSISWLSSTAVTIAVFSCHLMSFLLDSFSVHTLSCVP